MRLDHEELRAFAKRVLCTVGVPSGYAETTADVLVCADLRGVDGHGTARLRRYVDGVRDGAIDGTATPETCQETMTTVVLDARNGLGQPASCMAVDRAMQRAVSSGLGMAVVRRSNHFGIAGYYALRAVKHGLFAIVGTNASPQVAPTHGARPMFGTNPLAVGFPSGGEFPFLYDGSTSVVPRGKLERIRRTGGDMPRGWAIGPEGEPATDLLEVIKGLKGRQGHALFPLGGEGELFGGHKGYGLALVVEILSGPLAGAMWGRHVYGPSGAGLGHFFICGRVDAFTPIEDFRAETARMFDELRRTPRARGAERIYLPGEREYEEERRRRVDGIPLTPAVVEDLERLAAETGVPLPAACHRQSRSRAVSTVEGGL